MHVLYKILPLTGFKLWTSGVRNNHSAICAKTLRKHWFTVFEPLFQFPCKESEFDTVFR